MSNKLTINYTPRCYYHTEYPLSHPINEQYVTQLTNWGMGRIKTAAKPYHEKHIGVKDNGTIGKDVTITKKELKQIIINSHGKSPNGVDIHFPPVGVLQKIGDAERLGFITNEQRGRIPSFDRIDSSKGYIPGNIQLTTKTYNLGKSNLNMTSTIPANSALEVPSTISIKWNGIEAQLNNVSSSFLANTMKELAK